MRLVVPAVLAIVSLAAPAVAADLDYGYRPRPPRAYVVPAYPPLVLVEPPPVKIYSNPVAGFYGYPYSYLAPVRQPYLRPLERPLPDPYSPHTPGGLPNGYELD